MAYTTIQQIIDNFDSYINHWVNDSDEIPFEIKTSIIRQIIRTGSIDTTRFIRAVDFRENGMNADGYRYLIDSARDSDVYYDGYVEVDGNKRKWIGRYNYRDGIESANLTRIFDKFAEDSFAR